MAAFVTTASTTTTLASLLETQYRPRMSLATSEEMMIGNNFEDATEGVEKIGNAVVIRKVLAKNATTIAGTSASYDAGALTYEADTEQAITVSPTSKYGAVALSRMDLNRLLASAEYQKDVRTQLVRALSEAADIDCGALANSLSTAIVGSGAVDIDKTLLLSALAQLRTNAKRYAPPNGEQAYLVVHPLQFDNLLAIPEVTQAQMRGDSANPNVSGMVWDAWGLKCAISGNVVESGGAKHNLLHIKQSHVLGWTEKPMVLEPQASGLATLLISYAEYGVAEVWDEYAVDVQTKTT